MGFLKNNIGWIYLAVPRKGYAGQMNWSHCDIYRFHFDGKKEHRNADPRDVVSKTHSDGTPAVIEMSEGTTDMYRLQTFAMKRTWSRRSSSDRKEDLETTKPNDVFCILTGWLRLDPDTVSYRDYIHDMLQFRTYAKINAGNIDLVRVLTEEAFAALQPIEAITTSGMLAYGEELV